jgi:hypothetical protein
VVGIVINMAPTIATNAMAKMMRMIIILSRRPAHTC